MRFPLRSRALAASLAFFLAWTQCLPAAFSGEFSVFKKTYVRDVNAPDTVIDAFGVLNPNTTWILRTTNGNLEDDTVEKVSSSTLTLNGTEVLQPNDFNQNVSFFDLPVTILPSNTVATQLRAKPGGQLTVEIVGQDNTPPTAQWISPQQDGFFNTATIAAELHLADDIAGLDPQSLEILLDGTSVAGDLTPLTDPTLQATLTGDLAIGEGLHTLTAQVQDLAGQLATASVSFTVDRTPPVITVSQAPGPNANGWNNTDVTVSFQATDTLSGIASVTPPVLVTTEGAGQIISGTATDRAGNTATIDVTLNIDKTPPVISASINPLPNANGWNNSDVTVTPIASDNVSGIDSIDPPVLLTEEGADQAVTHSATDLAGNSASITTSINIDKTLPNVEITFPIAGSFQASSDVTVFGTVDDNLSGLAAVTCNGVGGVIGGSNFTCDLTLNLGLNTITAVATDRAGNTSDSTISLNFIQGPVVTIASPENFSLVNSETITVTGFVSDPSATVVVEGIQATISNNTFTAEVTIHEGDNIITAVGENTAGGISTATVQVSLDSRPPTVLIQSISDGAVTHNAMINVSGMVNDLVIGTVNEPQCQVTVNGIPALVANRSFLATDVPLNPGSNTITAIGTDRAGNTATDSVAVIFEAIPSTPIIQIISGNNQSASIGTPLANPLVVGLFDDIGSPVSNETVIFKVEGSNGLLSDGVRSGPSLAVTTDLQGRAQAFWTLGTRSGVGNHMVEVSATGFGGPAVFSAIALSAEPDKINMDSGNNQKGIIGQQLPLPFVAIVTDAGHNRLGNVPVTYTVLEGDGNFDGLSTLAVNTDSDGRALAFLTLGLEEGIDNNLVEATFPGNPGFPVSFVASASLPADPALTKITGVVLDNTDIPIEGVTVNIEGTGLSTLTDAQGQFVLQPAPVGHLKLFVDGSTANRAGTWPDLEYELVTVPGQDNTVGMPIYLLPLDIENGLLVSETEGGVLTLDPLPGFSLVIEPGSATFPDGSKSGVVSVTLVHADKIPMTPNFGQQPRFIVTIQPAGVLFDPPAPITLPNVDGMAPGEVTELYSFDHDLGQFVAIGTGTVSEDGTVIASDPGVGIIKGGWHCGGNPATTGSAKNAHISVSPKPITLAVGETAQITAIAGPRPKASTPFTWTSDTPGIADKTGFTNSVVNFETMRSVATVQGNAPGTANITVKYTCKSGAMASAKVDVTVICDQEIIKQLFEQQFIPALIEANQREDVALQLETAAILTKKAAVLRSVKTALQAVLFATKAFEIKNNAKDVIKNPTPKGVTDAIMELKEVIEEGKKVVIDFDGTIKEFKSAKQEFDGAKDAKLKAREARIAVRTIGNKICACDPNSQVCEAVAANENAIVALNEAISIIENEISEIKQRVEDLEFGKQQVLKEIGELELLLLILEAFPEFEPPDPG